MPARAAVRSTRPSAAPGHLAVALLPGWDPNAAPASCALSLTVPWPLCSARCTPADVGAEFSRPLRPRCRSWTCVGERHLWSSGLRCNLVEILMNCALSRRLSDTAFPRIGWTTQWDLCGILDEMVWLMATCQQHGNGWMTAWPRPWPPCSHTVPGSWSAATSPPGSRFFARSKLSLGSASFGATSSPSA